MTNIIKEIYRGKMSPNSMLDWGFDWADEGANDGSDTDSGWLQGDTISDSSWDYSGPDAVLNLGTESNDTTTTGVILSAGTENMVYKVTNHITTSSGLEDDRTIEIRIVQR